MDKAQLLSMSMPTGEVTVPGVGAVKVRGMNRDQLNTIGQSTDAKANERVILAACMTDPQLTEEEVGQWQAVAPAGVILDVVEEINRLSGLSGRAERAEKEAYKSLRDG